MWAINSQASVISDSLQRLTSCIGVVQQVEGMEHFGKWLADSWQSLGICKAIVAGVRDMSYPKVTQSCPTVSP